MKGFLQWTKATPQDYDGFASANWSSLQKKAEPTGGETIDQTPGWIFGLTFQGIYFRGYDHYHIEHIAAGEVVVTTWNDDPVEFPPGEKWARVTRFKHLIRDAGGLYNTRVAVHVYAQPATKARFDAATPVEMETHPWNLFTAPADDLFTRHGIWVSPALADSHNAFLGGIGWTRYTTNVPAEDVVGTPPDDMVVRGP